MHSKIFQNILHIPEHSRTLKFHHRISKTFSLVMAKLIFDERESANLERFHVIYKISRNYLKKSVNSSKQHKRKFVLLRNDFFSPEIPK